MHTTDPTASHNQGWIKAKSNCRPEGERRHADISLTRGQRWLACATAIAVLLSGLNALVQVWKVLIEYHAHHG